MVAAIILQPASTVPNAVWLETQAKNKEDNQLIREAREIGWLRVVSVDITQHFPRSLHDGENEALQLACNEQDTLLILDARVYIEAMRKAGYRVSVKFLNQGL